MASKTEQPQVLPPAKTDKPQRRGPKPNDGLELKKSRRVQKDENDLREMARRHLSYEIKMLRELSAALQGKGVGPRTLNNALLESFLIHYRNLYDFFYPENKRRLPFDIAATDYLPAPHWRKVRPKADIKKIVENRERVNSLLAHLSLRRLRYTTRSWPDKKMAGAIEEMVEAFIGQLPQSRKPWFASVIAKKRAGDVKDAERETRHRENAL